MDPEGSPPPARPEARARDHLANEPRSSPGSARRLGLIGMGLCSPGWGYSWSNWPPPGPSGGIRAPREP